MKAIFIDAHNREVTEIDVTSNQRELCAEIDRLLQCDTFTLVTLNAENDCIFVDDEGLLVSDLDAQVFFRWKGYPEPLAGNGVLLGTDDDGVSVSPRAVTLEMARENVRFFNGVRNAVQAPV